MSEFLDRISKLSPQRLALLADELNERLLASEKRRRVPLAIVGIGCRMPGEVRDPEGFWKLLSDGVDAISEVPPSRWDVEEFYDRNPDTPGKMATRWGGFIEDPDQFDPKFFGIAPAEATSMDPQQRLLLETAWESLENAGIAPTGLAGTQTGVFVGICNADYSQIALNVPRESFTPYLAPGVSHAVAAGRISYVLGLQGPSLAIDTSCSASLVAVHLACQSLRLGESDTALAGGVNLVFNQDITIALSQSKMMAPDGRCKAFSQSANGFVRGEGCGVIVLKRLPDAIRDRNRILAVIRGSACNQDGRSNGLTAPNGPSQEAVIASALADADMRPDDLDYIEAHGTGTALGDPIEAGALNAVFASRSAKAEPLFVGSVKTNVGHLESAAGIAGLIKLVLSIQHGKIPASLHAGKLNNRIEWDRLPLKIPTRLQTWDSKGGKRAGGVSSFGFSGTNAHVIVEEYLNGTPTSPVANRPFLFQLSAKTETALRTMAGRLYRHLTDQPLILLADIARTLDAGRSHFEYRAGITAASHLELLKLLSALEKNTRLSAIQTGRAAVHSPRIAFVFNGKQRHDGEFMRDLYSSVPVFRESLLRCEEILKDVLEKPLTSMLYPETGTELLNGARNRIVDPPAAYRKAADFALQYAVAEVWRSCGIEPAVVYGFGVGEYVAACIAQVFSLEDGLRLAMAEDAENFTEFKERVHRVSYSSPRTPLVPNGSTKVGEGSGINSAEYWLRRSEASAPDPSALSALAREKCTASVYIGGSLALQDFKQNAVSGLAGKWLASLGEGEGDCQQFLNAAASLYILGCEPDMSGFYRDAANLVALPTYPFERERYWLDFEKEDRNGHSVGNQNEIKRPSAGMSKTGDGVESDEWIYDLVWEPRPLPHELLQQSTGGFNEGVVENMAIRRADDELLRFAEFNVRLDPVCSGYIVRALQKMGADSLPKQAFTLQELCQRLKVAAPRRRLFERLLAVLVQDGLAEQMGESYRLADFVATTPERLTSEAQLQKLQISYPMCQTEINIVRRCGENLADVLLGTTDPVHLLFPNNSMEETEHIYRDSPMARFYNGSIAEVVQTALGQATGRVVRILEIGAGTGATTASVLPRIVEKDIEYTFTDVSPAFLSRARGKFSDFGFVKYRVLNIETDPIEQGFEQGGYDIIIAANVLHATADLRRTIVHAQKLLAPRGLLLLLEATQTYRCVDLTFGLTDGWWRFVDHDVRLDCPLASADTWIRLLREAGMASTRTMTYLTDDGSSSQQALIVAQMPSDSGTQTAFPISQQQVVRNWIIFADESGVGDALKTLLINSGQECQIIRHPHTAGEIGAIFDRLLGQADSGQIEVVYLWGIDVSGPDTSVADSRYGLSQEIELCANTPIHLIQTLLRRKGNAAGLWMVTRGSQATASFSPDLGGSVQSLVWGIGRTIGLEAPERFRALIDLDPAQTPEGAAARLFSELLADDREDQIAYRHGERLVARLKNSSLKNSTTEAVAGIRGDGSYLLVGGLGGVGLRLARWVAEQRPGHLVLQGKTGIGSNAGPFAAERLSAIKEIEKLGVQVTVFEGDVASKADMTRLFRRFGNELPALRGVFHTATITHGAELGDLTDESIETMLRPKVLGAWVLHELTKNLNLDFFLVFSSAASLLGATGLAHYAAANQFLDSFAHYRRAVGLPMLSINWGAWDVMRLASSQAQNRFSEIGLLPMSSGKLLNIFPKLIASDRAQIMIANVDWNVLKPALEVKRVRPMLNDFGNRPSKPFVADVVSVSLPASLHAAVRMTPEDRARFIEAFVLKEAAQVLGFRGSDVPRADVPLPDIGLDSLMAVDLKNRLQIGLGQELSPTIVFDYPTVSDIVGMLETMLWAAHGSAEDSLTVSQKEEIRI